MVVDRLPVQSFDPTELKPETDGSRPVEWTPAKPPANLTTETRPWRLKNPTRGRLAAATLGSSPTDYRANHSHPDQSQGESDPCKHFASAGRHLAVLDSH